jgi:hypothetical protein
MDECGMGSSHRLRIDDPGTHGAMAAGSPRLLERVVAFEDALFLVSRADHRSPRQPRTTTTVADGAVKGDAMRIVLVLAWFGLFRVFV